MKTKYLILSAAMVLSANIFAQKDEIKAAEKALKKGNATEARNFIMDAEKLISGASDSDKAQFYFVKGSTLYELLTKNIESKINLVESAKAFQELFAIEKTSGKSKYTPQALAPMQDMKSRVFNMAAEENDKKNYKSAGELFYQAYQMDKTGLDNLYYAATEAVQAKEYDTAIKQYNELLQAKYTGAKTVYWAKSLVSGKEEQFATKADRDKYIGLKTHSNARDENMPSKLGEIYRNITQIYIATNKLDEAKKAIKDARTSNPDDVSLAISEANLYLQSNDKATYKKLITEVIQRKPNDAELYFNLGVISAENKEPAEAMNYYKKAIEIDPKQVAAYLNLSILKLEPVKGMETKMNKLTTSPADSKKYETLKAERKGIFKDVLPYLEKAYELSENDKDNKAAISSTLQGVYRALDMMDKAKALKAKM